MKDKGHECNLGRMVRPKSEQWMTFKINVEIKNAPLDPKMELFSSKVPK